MMHEVTAPAVSGKGEVSEACALAVVCPFCGVDRGEQCCTTDRGGVNVFVPRAPHALRVKAARKLLEAAAVKP